MVPFQTLFLRKIFYKIIQEGANWMSKEIELLNMGIHLCKQIKDLLEEREHRNLGFKQSVTKNALSPLPLEHEKKIISFKRHES